MGVSSLSEVDTDGGPSSVVQSPLLKPDVDATGGGGTIVAWVVPEVGEEAVK